MGATDHCSGKALRKRRVTCAVEHRTELGANQRFTMPRAAAEKVPSSPPPPPPAGRSDKVKCFLLKRLSRDTGHRHSMLKTMTTQLIKHERIETTVVKVDPSRLWPPADPATKFQ